MLPVCFDRVSYHPLLELSLPPADVTALSGPNGNIDWMNCGLTAGGWNPPHVTVNDVITVDLGAALNDPNTPFKACSPYIDLFYKYAGEHGSE